MTALRYGRNVEPSEDWSDEVKALFQAATADREANRVEEARRGYARLVELLGAMDDRLSQLGAAGAEMWQARLAFYVGDLDGGRPYLLAARERSVRVESRWGQNLEASRIQVEVAAELGRIALHRGDERAALAELKHALELAARADADRLETDDLETAVRRTAFVTAASGRVATAVGLAEALVALRAGDPLKSAAAQGILGDVFFDLGDFHNASVAYRAGDEALAEQTEREPTLLRAKLLNHAGLAVDRMGEYALAAVFYEGALQIQSDLLPADHPELLLNRYNVAELRRHTGDDVALAARELAAIAEKQPKTDPQALGLTLKNLAQAQLTLRMPGEAEQTSLKGLALRLDPELRGKLLVTLAQAREEQGREPQVADELARVASQVAVRMGEHSLDNLHLRGQIAWMLRHSRAAESEQIWNEIADALADDPDPDARSNRSQALTMLALARWARGDLDAALEAFEAALPAVQELRAELWRVGSTLSTQSAPSAKTEERWPVTAPMVRMVARQLAHSDRARRLAFGAAVADKCLQAEVLTKQRELALKGRPELLDIQALAAQLRRAAAWAPGDEVDLGALASLETAIAREVPREALLTIVERSSADAIASSLPPNSALVEYAVFPAMKLDEKADGLNVEHPWCVAFVLPSGEPEELAIVDLGKMPVIEGAVEALRDTILDVCPAAADWRENGRALAHLVWDPIAERLPTGVDVFVAPDGVLCSVPFDALVEASHEPLLVARTITLLATGRDAHRIATRANAPTNPPTVIAAPDFGEPWEPFGPLHGSLEEGLQLADMLEVAPFLGPDATREVVLGLADPEIVHLATHGYYLTVDAPQELTARLAARAAESPLMSAGIALAGANDGSPAKPGVASALDVLALPLSGTDLVVLSACESGLGQLDAGEGLLGLARSFMLGGARSAVWSLWRVDDSLSLALVKEFYARLLRESGRAIALRRAKLSAYAEHPDRVDVWAGFALQGDPGPLARFRFIPVPDDQIYTQPVRADDEEHMLDTDDKPAASFELDVGSEDRPLKITVASLNLRNIDLALAENLLFDGNNARLDGRFDDARRHYEEALDLLEDGRPGSRLLTAELHARLAIVAARGRHWEDSCSNGQVAAEIFEDIGGHDRKLAATLDSLAIAEFNCGHHQQALVQLDRALAIKRTAFPAGHEQIQFTVDQIATLRALLRP